MIGIIIVPVYTFFNTSLSQYISLQAEGSSFSDLATQSQRVANVMRGLTDINSVSATDIDCYAYFAPSDAYVSSAGAMRRSMRPSTPAAVQARRPSSVHSSETSHHRMVPSAVHQRAIHTAQTPVNSANPFAHSTDSIRRRPQWHSSFAASNLFHAT